MFDKDFQRMMVAGIASILMTGLTVGATVLPTQSVASPLGQVAYA